MSPGSRAALRMPSFFGELAHLLNFSAKAALVFNPFDNLIPNRYFEATKGSLAAGFHGLLIGAGYLIASCTSASF